MYRVWSLRMDRRTYEVVYSTDSRRAALEELFKRRGKGKFAYLLEGGKWRVGVLEGQISLADVRPFVRAAIRR